MPVIPQYSPGDYYDSDELPVYGDIKFEGTTAGVVNTRERYFD